MLNEFTNLCTLDFHSCYKISDERISFHRLGETLSSSTLMELYVNVSRFTDCLLLLDGRFPRLHTFYVNIPEVCPPSRQYIKKVNEILFLLLFIIH